MQDTVSFLLVAFRLGTKCYKGIDKAARETRMLWKVVVEILETRYVISWFMF